jgi:hypothetical protein
MAVSQKVGSSPWRCKAWLQNSRTCTVTYHRGHQRFQPAFLPLLLQALWVCWTLWPKRLNSSCSSLYLLQNLVLLWVPLKVGIFLGHSVNGFASQGKLLRGCFVRIESCWANKHCLGDKAGRLVTGCWEIERVLSAWSQWQ